MTWRFMLGMLVVVAIPDTISAQGNTAPVKVGGVIYAHYRYLLSDEAGSGNNFDVARAYINVTGTLGHGVAFRITPDIHRTDDESLTYRLKYAYAAYTPSNSPVTVKLGQIQTPWVDFEETLWDFRMQGTIALDRSDYLTSSDLGLSVDGSWDNGGVSAAAGIYNGEGYGNEPGDKRKDVAGRVSVRLASTDDDSRTGGLRVSAFGHYGSPTGGGVRSRALGMLSYRSKLFTVAGEYAITRDRADDPLPPDLPDLATARGNVITAFGVLRVPDSPVMLIGRVDVVDPDVDAGGDRQTRVIGGIGYQFSPNLRLLADIDHLAWEGVAPSAEAEASRTQALFQIALTF